MKSCVFCNIPLTKSNRSNEHVIPAWLQKNRGIPDDILSAGFGEASTITVERKMDMDSFLAGNVCEDCNTGWMEALETASRDILIRLLDRKTAPEDLTGDESRQLAKWTVKTASACNSALSGEPKIDTRFVKQFDFARNDNLGTCGIFAGRVDIPNRFGYIQTTADNPMFVGSNPAEFRVAICLDGIFLTTLILSTEGLGYTFEILKNIHIPIWPGRGHEYREDVELLLTGTEADLKIVNDALKVRYRFDLS